MNKENIVFHLQEAKEELDRIISEFQRNPEYESAEYLVQMSHLYHHINTAWNSRDASEKEVEECSEENFNKWRQFPDAEGLLLDS